MRYSKRMAVITPKRIANLLKAFSWAEWDVASIKIVNEGQYKDKPQWEIKGTYKDATLIWRSNSPGGGYCSMRIKNASGKIKKYSHATFISSEKIKEACDEFLCI